jgi:hypothetical protein
MTHIYDIDQDDDVNRQIAEEEVEKKFRKPPLYGMPFHRVQMSASKASAS